jgi:exodeoxyribonuclease VII small subunit
MSLNTDLSSASSTPVEDLSFLQASDELESIVRALESNQLELEDSLLLYERGVTLLRSLKTRLDNAEQKVEVLMGTLEPETPDSIDTELS